MLSGKQLQIYVTSFVEEDSALKNLRPKTVKNRRNALARFTDFLGEKTFNFESTKQYILFLLTEKNREPSGVRAELKVIRSFCAYLVENEVIESNFSKRVPTPKVPRTMREFITEELAEKAIILGTSLAPSDNKHAQYRKMEMRIAMRFLLRTGIRISEAGGITGSDLLLDAELPVFFVISKGGERESVILPPDLIEELRPRKTKARLFDITPDGCNRALARGCKALGVVEQTVHDLRHIYSLTRLNKGEPLQLVSRNLRHSNVGITDRYYSHYNMQELAVTAYASDVIQSGVTVSHLFDRVEKAVKRTGVEKDSRIEVITERNAVNEIIIRVKARTV
jgi:integrase